MAGKSRKDSRPESFTPVLDSIAVGEFIDTDMFGDRAGDDTRAALEPLP